MLLCLPTMWLALLFASKGSLLTSRSPVTIISKAKLC